MSVVIQTSVHVNEEHLDRGNMGRTGSEKAESLEGGTRRGVPGWPEVDQKNMQGTVKALPNREEITMPIQEQRIVELYST